MGGEKAKTTVLWAPNIKIIFQVNHFGLSQNAEDKTWGLILSQMSLVLSLEGGKMELILILNINNVGKRKISKWKVEAILQWFYECCY